ncbi:MAG TPA: hypothetical protein VNZ53_58945 [Steroidobacteraceae bacterium]|nr:hypothetical protein [Steroidobacteraceae bacterium]
MANAEGGCRPKIPEIGELAGGFVALTAICGQKKAGNGFRAPNWKQSESVVRTVSGFQFCQAASSTTIGVAGLLTGLGGVLFVRYAGYCGHDGISKSAQSWDRLDKRDPASAPPPPAHVGLAQHSQIAQTAAASRVVLDLSDTFMA